MALFFSSSFTLLFPVMWSVRKDGLKNKVRGCTTHSAGQRSLAPESAAAGTFYQGCYLLALLRRQVAHSVEGS